MAEIKNEIITNVIARCVNANEVACAIGALVTAGVISMNDVIKTMYKQCIEEKSSYDRIISSYEDEMSYYDDEIAALNEEKAELTAKIAELENKLDEFRVEMIWNDDTPVKLKELLEKLL